MINYELKAKVLSTDLPKRLNKLDREHYLGQINGVVRDDALEEKYFNLYNEFGGLYVKEAKKINAASYRRVKRLRERIISYLQYPCVFLTLTFKDEVLNDTSEKTRRKYVSRFLRTISNHYLANIDYGETITQREHYHALCVGKIRKKDLQDWTNNYGFTYIETVRSRNSSVQLAKYISKLTNHAIKQSTRRHVYIYSRDN